MGAHPVDILGESQRPLQKVKVVVVPEVVEKLGRISLASSRPLPELFAYFVRKSCKEMPWSSIVCHRLPVDNWYTSKPKIVRLARPLILHLNDVAWMHGITSKTQGPKTGGAGYLIGLCAYIQLRKKTIDEWITFFDNGDDIIETIIGELNGK